MPRTITIFIALLFSCLLFLTGASLHAQSVTTAAISGTILDKDGKPLPGATVIAVHNPTGTKFGINSRNDGKFNLQNLLVGGPYTVTVTYIGFETEKLEDLFLALGQNMRMNFSLKEQAVSMTGVEVVADRDAIISSARTGASQNVSRMQIDATPNTSRSFADFTKLSPLFTGTNYSANGRNNRFNNIQLDGTQYNDLFGLGSSGTPGGQANTTPISLDAIQEFQIVIAPFDVRQGGFTGGGVNAITRSGSNAFHGSLFGYFQNQNFVGLSPDSNKTKYGTFQNFQTGFRAGGPVIENKLFFFVNGELTNRQQPTDIMFSAPGVSGSNVSPIALDSVAKFADILRNKYGYDPGTYNNVTTTRKSAKLFLRFDYALAENHRLTLRHNLVNANDDNLSRSLTTFFLENSNYVFNSNTNSTVLSLNSTFGNSSSNELIFGYTRIRDKRNIQGAAFPFVKVRGIGAGLDLDAGTENFSMANSLDQDIFEITDNFSYFLGDHVFTFGTHNEMYKFTNLFIRNMYGYYEFNNLTDFSAGRPSDYQLSYSLTSDPMQAAKFSVMQYGLYAQDEWTAIPGLKFNLGVRMDIPSFPDKPAYNAKIDSTFNGLGLSTDKVPSGQLLFSPRFGFNWDAMGNRTVQVRGGAGIFSGRVAYVWISNQYGNTGVEFARVDARSNIPTFNPDPFNQPRPGVNPQLIPITTSEVDLTDNNFKMPQVMRIDLATDAELPFGVVGTLEAVYSKAVNDIMYQDINLGPQQSTLAGDGRPVYGTYNTGSKTFSAKKINPAFTNVILMKNTDQGYSYNFVAQLQRRFADGWYATLAYTNGVSKDLNSVLSSQAFSQWRFNHVKGDPNNPDLSYSAFDIRNRVLASVTYRKEFFENFVTTISLFYNGQSGQPFSYVYDGDVNGDGQVENDLIYVPKDENDIILKSANYAKLNEFIESDDALKNARGTIIDRMSARNPWSHQLDLRLAQEIPMPALAGHRFELTFDVLNFLNLLNHDWGYTKFVSNQRYRMLKFEGLDATSNKPIYSFNDKVMSPYETSSLASRWQLQIGLRYSF
jgi:hypothetical protein